MTEKNLKSKVTPIKELLGQDREFLKPLIRATLQERRPGRM